jgi:CRISPR-associated protein Cas2
MYVLITYDVATTTDGGARRLRRVAKACLDYGQRVQYSFFELKLEPAHLVVLRDRLQKIIDEDADSIRIYHLGNRWRQRTEHLGTKKPLDPDGPIIV